MTDLHRIGYACINTDLRRENIFTNRTLIVATANKRGIDYIKELVSNNVDDLLKIIIYNEAHGIRFFRISSCLFPHLGNPRIENSAYDLTFVKNKLKMIGEYAKSHKHRLTMHPGQFVQLGSPTDQVVKASFIDLENHVKLLQMLGYKPSDGAVLIIHGGGTYGNKKLALERWRENFLKLPIEIRSYISLENDEYGYGIMDLLPVCEELGIPFCLDIFHNKISADKVQITKHLIARIFKTWTNHGGIPKIHVSEQEPGLRKGAHSKTLDRLPSYLLALPYVFDTPLDIMLEVKDKEVSVFKMYYKYFDIKMSSTGKVDYALKKKIQNDIIEKIDKKIPTNAI